MVGLDFVHQYTQILQLLQCDASRFSHWNVARRFSRRKSPLVVCAVFGGMFLYSGKNWRKQNIQKRIVAANIDVLFPDPSF